MALLHALRILRRHPDDPGRLDTFLRLARPPLLRAARTFTDPDEVAQVAWIRVALTWPSCRADSERSLLAWLRRIALNCGRSLRPRAEPLPPEAGPPAPRRPDETASDRARGRALEQAIAQALAIEPAELPRHHRVAARAAHVAATREGLRRDVAIALALREDGLTVAEIARTLGLSEAAVKQAASRGAAAVALGGRVAAERAADPLERDALHEIGLRLRRRQGIE